MILALSSPWTCNTCTVPRFIAFLCLFLYPYELLHLNTVDVIIRIQLLYSFPLISIRGIISGIEKVKSLKYRTPRKKEKRKVHNQWQNHKTNGQQLSYS